jgi:hypothetical protein
MDHPELEKIEAQAKAEEAKFVAFVRTYCCYLFAAICFCVGILIGRHV